MQRRLDLLADRHFDLLVIGGGICGLTIACDAAQRGLSVALVERGDFGAATTFNHLRTIHGGLRYLQRLDLARARESIFERRTLARIAPWAVEPLPFVLPLSPALMKGPLAMRAGFLLDRLLARERNSGLPASHHLPPGEVLRPGAALERFPFLRGIPMAGAAVWYDYVAPEADALTFAWAKAADAHGATLANYVDVQTLERHDGRIVGAAAIDGPTRTPLTIRARAIVNATGAALDRLLTPAALQTGVPMTLALNVVTRLEVPPVARGRRAAAGRNLFMVPWRGRALFGTWESGEIDRSEKAGVRASLVSAFMQQIRAAFPELPLRDDDVTLVHRGLVPAASVKGAMVPDGSDHIHDHAAAGHPEAISVAGTKYTTARAVAEKITTLVLARLGRSGVPSRTATTPLPAPPPGDIATRLDAAARDAMVVGLEDAVIRRTPLGALGPPPPDVLDQAAAIVGAALGWDAVRQASEIDAVRRFYSERVPER